MCHRCPDDNSPMHRIETNSHPLTHAARPVVHKDHNGSLVGEGPPRSNHLDPVSLNVWLTIARDSVPLIRLHRLHKPPHNTQRYGAIASAWYISEIKNKATCGVELFLISEMYQEEAIAP